ncbi:hypothetical protein SeLEV6574_g01840 [Synchytrium endobioticum]|uniref:ABC transporter domain-containing protein n=1 Tax=Synchytrium endobioticum TaxID=286115 RepID=A0A507DBR4_9FUNG|nr:hypothetical protein SeLEV6574_g01840 [Synchytrium endobioticum]
MQPAPAYLVPSTFGVQTLVAPGGNACLLPGANTQPPLSTTPRKVPRASSCQSTPHPSTPPVLASPSIEEELPARPRSPVNRARNACMADTLSAAHMSSFLGTNAPHSDLSPVPSQPVNGTANNSDPPTWSPSICFPKPSSYRRGTVDRTHYKETSTQVTLMRRNDTANTIPRGLHLHTRDEPLDTRTGAYSIDYSDQELLDDHDPDPDPDNAGVELSWRQLNYVVDQYDSRGWRLGFEKKSARKQVLYDMNGHAKPGEILAIMGGSGAGKTTLLNVLSGRARGGRATGDVRFNNEDVDAWWQSAVGYVQQQDLFFETLTVRETLQYAALLKLPDTMTHQQKMARVDKVVAQMRLSRRLDTKVGNSTIRGISGGEKKRLHIASELLGSPKVLFLDEPTSGLDAYNAYKATELIKKNAKKAKRTVVMTIHQPRKEILDLFDKILLLSRGRVVFYGSIDSALSYFAHIGYPVPPLKNPADHFLDVATLDNSTLENKMRSEAHLDQLTSIWRDHFDSIAFPPYTMSPTQRQQKKRQCTGAKTFSDLLRDARIRESDIRTYGAWGWWKRFGLLMLRHWQVYSRDTELWIMALASNMLAIVLFGYLWHHRPATPAGARSRLALFFMFGLDRYLSAVFGCVLAVPLRLSLYLRERTSGMYPGYMIYWATYTATWLQFTLLTVAVLVAVYLWTGLQSTWMRFVHFFAAGVLLDLAGHTCGFVIGSSTDSVDVGLTAAILMIGIFAGFAGYVIVSANIPAPLKWISYINPSYYSYHVWAQNELAGLVLTCSPSDIVCLPTGDSLLDLLALRPFSAPVGLAVLFSLSVVFALIGAFIFDRFTRPTWMRTVQILSEGKDLGRPMGTTG